jgi:hypothetical protein
MSPAGLELDREIGGMKVSPAVLAEGLPIVIEAPVAKDKTGKPVARDPHKTVIIFRRPFWSVMLSPDDVIVNEQGFVLRSAVAFALRDEQESDAEKQKRNSLRHALTENAPHKDCKSLTGLKLLGGDVKISDLYKEIQYVAESLKAHVEVAQHVADTPRDYTELKPLPSRLFASLENNESNAPDGRNDCFASCSALFARILNHNVVTVFEQ